MDNLGQVQTDESVWSIADCKPEQVLSRMLSTKSYVSTTSSLGDNIPRQGFQEIGKGQCGTIYALGGTNEVAKIPNSPMKVAQLLTDFKIHSRILQAMNEVETAFKMDINIPSLHLWVTPESKGFWSHYGLRSPQAVDSQNFALVSSRISAVPLPVREAIVEVICPPAIRRQKQEFLARLENKNCLIRTYLGRREITKAKTNVQNIRLQNFPLHVNEMEDLRLDTSFFAQIMAQTLAILHWKAGVDGNDVEFILGESPRSTQMPSTHEMEDDDEFSLAVRFRFDFSRRSISLWLIDFNQCSKFEDDNIGLKALVDAFFWNDPYYPRPDLTTEQDKKLWTLFRNQYLDVSRMFTNSATPGRFIAKVEERSRKGTVGGLF